MHLAGEPPPVVGAEAGGDLEHPIDVRGPGQAAEIDAAVAEAARDRHLLGGQLQEECLALVRRRRLPLGQLQQLRQHHHAGDFSRLEEARRRAAQDIHVGHRRHLQVVRGHVAQQLVLLAGIPADLADDEPRAMGDLLGQLEVLRHHLALVPLVVVDHRAQEKARRRQGAPAAADAGVHGGEHAQQPHRIGVEHRARLALVAAHREVAGEGENVVEAEAAKLPAAALQGIAVPVLARQMDHHLLTARDQVGAERVSAEHGIAAGVVGDRKGVDLGVGDQIAS